MKEIDFKDRVPTYPGRVKLSPIAGAENTYKMERADEPIEQGTPIDKALYNSIVQSRLTGRFYEPTYTKATASVNTLNYNPIPASGWVENGETEATNGQFTTTASESQTNPAEAFDGTWSTTGGWRPAYDDDAPWIAIDLGTPVVLKGVKIYFISDAWATNCTIAGSNNGTTWTDIATIERPTTNGAITWTFDNTTSYQYYRLSFDNTGVRLYGWEITTYILTTYKNEFTVAEFPASWTKGQIALVATPSDVTTMGVTGNTLNGVSVNTILQPSKRYEIRYTGTAFNVKEV